MHPEQSAKITLLRGYFRQAIHVHQAVYPDDDSATVEVALFQELAAVLQERHTAANMVTQWLLQQISETEKLFSVICPTYDVLKHTAQGLFSKEE